MSEVIRKLTIKGFKSIRNLEDFELRPLNVLIGANGAGKSNFVSFFRLLRELIEKRLQLAVRETEGGADACLHMGPKVTRQFTASIFFGSNGYQFDLRPTPGNQFVFADETVVFAGIRTPLGSGHQEARLKDLRDSPGSRSDHGVPYCVYKTISSWVVYHFHDTSLTAGVRREQAINDNAVFQPDAQNLAPFLYRIRQTDPASYSQIRDIIRLAAPYFDDFTLRPAPSTPDRIQLEWLQRDSDRPFQANQLSDGTLRFICLVTALRQPVRPPTMLFDEPELGLHPYALTLLGNLFRQAPDDHRRQIIISTQSASLLNEFAPEDVIVVEREQGQSTFQRLSSDRLSKWLEEYTLGELWQKNVLGARPHVEDMPQIASGWSADRS